MLIDYHTMPLKALRSRVDLSQREVADIIGVTPQTVAAWEKDSSDMPAKYLVQFSHMYAYPTNEIYIGPMSDISDTFNAQPNEHLS